MRAFYQMNQEHTLGVGFVRDGFWYPLPQVELLPEIFRPGREHNIWISTAKLKHLLTNGDLVRVMKTVL